MMELILIKSGDVKSEAELLALGFACDARTCELEEECPKRTPISYKLKQATTGESQIWAVTDASNATISYPSGEVVNVTVSNGVGNFGFNSETIFYNEAGNGTLTLEFERPMDEPVLSFDNMANGNKWGNFRLELWDGTIITNPAFTIDQLRPPATNPEGFVVFNAASTVDDLTVTTGSVAGVDYVTDDFPTNGDGDGQAGGIVRFTGSFASQGGIRKVLLDHESVTTFFTGFVQFAGKIFNFNPCIIGFHDECGKIYDVDGNVIDPATITFEPDSGGDDDTSAPDYTAQFDAMVSNLDNIAQDTTELKNQLIDISTKIDGLDDNADTQELLDIIAELQASRALLSQIELSNDAIVGAVDGIETQLSSIEATLKSEMDQSQVIQQNILNKMNEPCSGSPQNVKVCVDSVERTSGGSVETTAGTSPAGKVAISFHNNSDTITMQVDGLPLGAGETVPFGVDAPDTNSPKEYDPNGGEMIIRWIDA